MSWDDIHAGARFIREQNALARQYQEETRRLNAETAGIRDTKQRFHMVCAEIGAAESIMKEFLPDHPYFRLRDAIRAEGMRVALSTDNTDDSYGAGANFPLPPYTPPLNPEVLHLREEIEALRALQSEQSMQLAALNAQCEQQRQALDEVTEREQAANAKIDGAEKALRAMERDCVHHMALHYALREELARVEPQHVLVASVARRSELADQAYERYVLSRNWSAVADVARTFLQDQQAKREREFAGVFAALAGTTRPASGTDQQPPPATTGGEP